MTHNKKRHAKSKYTPSSNIRYKRACAIINHHLSQTGQRICFLVYCCSINRDKWNQAIQYWHRHQQYEVQHKTGAVCNSFSNWVNLHEQGYKTPSQHSHSWAFGSWLCLMQQYTTFLGRFRKKVTAIKKWLLFPALLWDTDKYMILTQGLSVLRQCER